MSIFSLKNDCYKQVIKYCLVSMSLLMITLIYECFSHGVTSDYMRVACLYPLVGGSLVTLIVNKNKKPSSIARTLWRMGLTTLTFGSFILGIFEIYGSIEETVYLYFYLGSFFLFIAILLYLFEVLTKKQKNKENV